MLAQAQFYWPIPDDYPNGSSYWHSSFLLDHVFLKSDFCCCSSRTWSLFISFSVSVSLSTLSSVFFLSFHLLASPLKAKLGCHNCFTCILCARSGHLWWWFLVKLPAAVWIDQEKRVELENIWKPCLVIEDLFGRWDRLARARNPDKLRNPSKCPNLGQGFKACTETSPPGASRDGWGSRFL